MRRYWAQFLIPFLFVALPLLAERDLRFSLPPESPENARTKALLRKPVDVYFEETPFDMAVDFLRELGNINIVIDESALGWMKPSDLRVKLKLRHIPLGTVLDFLARQVGLRYTVKKGVVYISDREGARDPVYTVTFDVRDLIIRVPDFAGPSLGVEGAPGEELGETRRRGARRRRGLSRSSGQYRSSRRSRSYYSLFDKGYSNALSPDEAGAGLAGIIREMFKSYDW